MKDDIKKKVNSIANQSEIARRMGEKPQTVNLWFKNGVPPQKILRLCACLAWCVTPHEIAPDLYPNKTDGLPDKASLIAG